MAFIVPMHRNKPSITYTVACILLGCIPPCYDGWHWDGTTFSFRGSHVSGSKMDLTYVGCFLLQRTCAPCYIVWMTPNWPTSARSWLWPSRIWTSMRTSPHVSSSLLPVACLTLNVWGPSYLGLTRSISWLLMPWLLTSPGHQQPWYWLCRIGKFLSYLRNDFNYLRRINVEKWHKM